MSPFLHSKIALCGLAFSLLAAASPSLGNTADTDPLGRAWGKKLSHFDGTMTNSKKDADQNMITEDTFDQNKIHVVRRLFFLDKAGHLRRGVVMDAKGNPKASTLYDYRGDNMVEERMFNANGQLIRRLFPPGVLPNVPQNQKRAISVTIDPSTAKELSRQATDERPVEPLTEAQQKFDPGVEMGRPLHNDRLQVTPTNATEAPRGRAPMLKQKAKQP